MKVAFAGLTHLGWIQMVVAAQKGHQVIGYWGPNEILEAPNWEQDFQETYFLNKERITFTHNIELLRDVDLAFVTLDVPFKNGRPSFHEVHKLAERVLADTSSPVVLMSQVPPGFCRELNNERLYYQAETLIFGKSLYRAKYPGRHIIGCDSPEKDLPKAMRMFYGTRIPILSMSYESAELSKLAINAFLAASISTAVLLDRVASHVQAQYDDVRQAMHTDTRIGSTAYLHPGSWSQSPHLTRDILTLELLAQKHQVDTSLIDALFKHGNQPVETLPANNT